MSPRSPHKKVRKLEDALYQKADEKRILLGDINFNVNKPSTYYGKNPTAEEILIEINKYKYGIAMTELIFDANPSQVNEVVIWPMRSAHKGKSGEVLLDITPGEEGHVRLEAKGTSVDLPAVADGESLTRGTRIIVLAYEEGKLRVAKFDTGDED